MDEQNICRFMPAKPAPDVLQAINYVYETTDVHNDRPALCATYRMHFAASGTAQLHCGGQTTQLRAGDLFFVFPGTPYLLKPEADFAYYYISYIGLRANMLMERFGINSKNAVLPGFAELAPAWREGLNAAQEVLDLAGESVLLHTFTRVGSRLALHNAQEKATDAANRMLLVKKYVDDHFSEAGLSMEQISAAFSYHKKYLSAASKKQFKVGVWEYLNIVRLNHAFALMENGHTSVQTIASLCGFNDALYFSKVFKQRMGVSPREYMRERAGGNLLSPTKSKTTI